MCSEDGAFTRCVVHIGFCRICICFPAISHYTRVLTMDEFDILAPILLIILVGANILFCIYIVPLGDILSWSRKHRIHSIDRFHCGRALSVSLAAHLSIYFLPVFF